MQSSERNVAFLSVTPDPIGSISGLIADVGDIGWDGLDEREAAYDRLPLPAPHEGVQIYKAAARAVSTTSLGQPILPELSRLCCAGVSRRVQARDGVLEFFRSTTGWDTPILNDRKRTDISAPSAVVGRGNGPGGPIHHTGRRAGCDAGLTDRSPDQVARCRRGSAVDWADCYATRHAERLHIQHAAS